MAFSRPPPITPETSSAEGLEEEPAARGEAKWKRLNSVRKAFRNIFRKKSKNKGHGVSDAKKFWSTSELSVHGVDLSKSDAKPSLSIGLSVSHDSIFHSENVDTSSSEVINVPRRNIGQNMFKEELFARVRARRDSDEDDAGLPHSPCTSPTTVDVLNLDLKGKSMKSRTTWSAGSLISMGSSEDDSCGHSSGHSSRMSLIDRKSLDSDGDNETSQHTPLNHNAAHHKIAVKPKRTHGLPRHRMKQLAASKVNTLPSTPEVTEDHGKLNNNANAPTTDVPLHNESIILKQSFEREMIHMTSSVSYNEMLEMSKETLVHKNKTISESCSQIFKTSTEDTSKAPYTESVEGLKTEACSLEKQEINNQQAESGSTETRSIENSEILQAYKCDFERLSIGNVMDNIKIVSNQSNPDINLFSSKENDSILNVSSLVKHVETSDYIENSEKSLKNTETSISDTSSEFSHFSLQQNANTKENSQNILENNLKQYTLPNLPIENCKEYVSICTNQIKCQNLEKSKIDILDEDTEFVLKPIKRKSFENNLEPTSDEKENKDASLSFLQFEDSVMTNKSFSTCAEESGISISHHMSFNNDVCTSLVTEAHNFAAVEENGVYIQTSVGACEKKNISEPWISCVDVPAPMKMESVITPNSTIPAFCDSKMVDEKITISVNSKSQAINSSYKQNGEETSSDLLKSPLVINQNISPKSKEKNSNKSFQKSNINETSSNAGIIKNDKRVSVEIVPFNQRMKERKHQPISFANKDASVDNNKKSCSNPVERKLSDRKVTLKSKECEKSNNRHSFSGSLEKKDLGAGKKLSKPEKIHEPVQFRIKTISKPEIQVKVLNSSNKTPKTSTVKGSANDIKLQSQISKASQNDSKLNEKSVNENGARWEVKIQPSLPKSQVFDSEDQSSLSSQASLISQNELQKSLCENEGKDSQNHTDTESPPVKNADASWKVPSSVDPEPELLRVFARRSIKQKHCDKNKGEECDETPALDSSLEEPPCLEKPKEEDVQVSNNTVIKPSTISKTHIKAHDLKKKSKSFSEKEKIVKRAASPLKEINLIHREPLSKLKPESVSSGETAHPRQRLASVPNLSLHVAPTTVKPVQSSSSESSPVPMVKEQLQKSTIAGTPLLSGSMNGSLIGISMKESQDSLTDKDGHAPSWIQLAQQRRELREQRERLLLGGSSNSFMDGSNKPTRSSKVWDMVNNFQKMQMT